MSICIFCGQLSFRNSTSPPGTLTSGKQENRFYKIINIIFNNMQLNKNSEFDISDLSNLARVNTLFSEKSKYIWKILLQNLTKNEQLYCNIKKLTLYDTRKIYQQIHSIQSPLDVSDQLVFKSIENNYSELLNILLDSGANMEVIHSSGKTPLSFACYLGDRREPDPIECAQVLLKAGADVSTVNLCTDQMSLLILAEARIRDIIDARNIGNLNGRTLLLAAAAKIEERNEALYTIRILLGLGADINAIDPNGRTALSFAAEKESIPAIKLLLGAGADINIIDSNGRTALSIAAEMGHEELLGELLEAGADINVIDSNGHTAFSFALDGGGTESYFPAKENYVEIIDKLLRAGADINAIDSNEALLFAIKMGHRKAVCALLRAGADINAIDSGKALSLAAVEGYMGVACELLKAGADINAIDTWSRRELLFRYGSESALSFAAMEGYIDVVKILLGASADINAKDFNGRTALSFAAEMGHIDVVCALLEANADIFITDNTHRYTASEYAEKNGHFRVTAMIWQKQMSSSPS